MLTERLVHPDVRTLLMSGLPFQYAHLIKFERPSRPESTTGTISTSAHRYTYLTDSSSNVAFDDLSLDLNNVANGSQNYIANKVLQVSGMQESIEAKASNFTITLDGNGIGAAVSGNVTKTSAGTDLWDIAWPASVDMISAGFREGDKVILTGTTTGSYNIVSFRANNIVRVKKITDAMTTGTDAVTMTLSSEEVKSILLNKFDINYASFINREVFVYRAYFQDGVMVGQTPSNGLVGPILLFKGIISAVSFDDDDNGIKVQWSLTSHWGDFAQIKGRITSDDFHRALDANGIPQPYSALKTVYAYDKGFMHAETSLNLLTDYTVQVEKQKVKAKSGFLGLGIGSKVKVKKYFVTETRHSSLDFQLTARSIPVIYGVRNIEGIPIFADTLLGDASSVYVIHAISEGPIGGIFDIYIDGKSMVCANQSDFDVRSAQNEEETIDVLCSGRADRGDVLLGTPSIGSTAGTGTYYQPVATEPAPGGGYQYQQEDLAITSTQMQYGAPIVMEYNSYDAPVTTIPFTSSIGGGLTHGMSTRLSTKQTITLDFFAGKEDQVSAPAIVNIAFNKGFKVQNDYWVGDDTAEYWGPNHRLLDTAYVVANYVIAEGETTIPTLEFIARGKILECFNYDYSYTHNDKISGESPDSFKLGQSVTLKNSAGTVLVSSTQIIDKWTVIDPDGNADVRFRWATPPNLGLNTDGAPSTTSFYMTNGTNNWNMVTFNHQLASGTITTEVSATITSIAPGSTGGTIITVPPTSPPATPPSNQPPAVTTVYKDDGATATIGGGSQTNAPGQIKVSRT